MKINPILATDFYKTSHYKQFPENTTMVYSNFTPRSNRHSNLPDNNDKIVFFGLQFYIKEFLIETFNEGFFNKDKNTVVAEYKRRMDTSLGKDAVPTAHIEALHDLGYLPVEIKALPEGSMVPMKMPCLTIHNTKPEFFWLTNYLETSLSAYLWKMCTSATTANWYKKLFTEYAIKTVGNADFVPFQGHDFSMRGMSGVQDSTMSGAAHLTSFAGTDTIPAIDLLEQYYNADATKELIGCSVPASEHAVQCAGGKETEFDTYKRFITELYPTGIVSIVSDTWDFFGVLTDILPKLKTEIMQRDGKVVIRPDSGNPADIICGLKSDMIERANGKIYKVTKLINEDNQLIRIVDRTKEISEAEVKGAVETLWDTFGGSFTEKGYKQLDSHIGLIYGDSITPAIARDIMERLEAKGFASTNVVLGIGSYTYQYNTRDTYGFAMKATYVEVDGVGIEIFKDPKTDDGMKKSAKGLLMIKEGVLYDQVTRFEMETGDLLTVFKDGEMLTEYSLADIRKRIEMQ